MGNVLGIPDSGFRRLLLPISALLLLLAGCASDPVPETRGEPEKTAPLPTLITEIVADETPERSGILIRGNRLLTYTSVRQASPPGLILYFSEASLGQELKTGESGFRRDFAQSGVVRSLTVSELAEKDRTVRVEVLLDKDAPCEISRDQDRGVRIGFAPLAGMPGGSPSPGAPLSGASGRTLSSGSLSPPPPPVQGPALEVWDPRRKAWVVEGQGPSPVPRAVSGSHATRLESVYARTHDEGLKVFVGADGPITNYKSFTIESPARIVFDVFNVRSPYRDEKRVPVNSRWVKQVRYHAYPDRVRVVLDTDKEWLSAFRAHPVEDGLEIRIGAPDMPGEPGSVASESPSAARLQSVYASHTGDGVVVTARGDGSITDYKTSVEEDPPRIIVDMFHVRPRPGEEENTFPVDTEWVRQVSHSSHPDKVRLVIDTRKAYLSEFSVSPDRNGLTVRVGGDAKTSAPRVAKRETPAVRSGKPGVTDLIVFVPESAGRSSLILETSQPVTYDVSRVGDKRLRLRVFNTRTPAYRHEQGPLVTTHFESAVDRITPVRPSKEKNVSVFEIELREFVPYFVEQSEESGKHHLALRFEASSIPPAPGRGSPAPPAEIAAGTRVEVTGGPEEAGPEPAVSPDPGPAAMPRQPDAPSAQTAPGTEPLPSPPVPTHTGSPPQPYDMPPGQPVPGMPAPQPPASSVPEMADLDDQLELPEEPAKKYTGEKIALDFFETDIKNVFRILREVSGKNFAVDNDVGGKVTLTLEHPVPWDQILDLILKMNGLGKTFEGDIIRIATLKTIQEEEKLRQEMKNKEREEREKQKEEEPLFTEYLAINYSKAKGDILPHIEQILSKERGKASVDDRTNILIITDTAAKIRRAKEIVEKLDRVTPQVIIEARIVEATGSFSRDIGAQWGLKSGFGQDSSGNDYYDDSGTQDKYGVGPQRGYNLLGGTYGYDMSLNIPAKAENPFKIGFNFLRLAGSPLQLDVALSAMETRGKLKIISTPKIVTLDNKKAVIKQGVRYPYNKRDGDGNTITEFEEVDLSLEVTPHVTPDSRISMNIKIAKKDLGELMSGGQSFTNKEAETELLVNDGDTLVIGGILKTTKRDDREGVPGLSRIPLIGWLFKSKSASDRKEELLIFITPRIIQLEQRRTQY